MPLTVVVGGQYGSEGKGKLSGYLAATLPGPVTSVRSGGSNAGHTVCKNGKTYRLRQLPCGVVSSDGPIRLAAGMVVDQSILVREAHEVGLDPRRLMVDRNAVMTEYGDSSRERLSSLRSRVGSTLSGTGAATARKVMRDPSLIQPGEIHGLKHFVGNVSEDLNSALDRGENVVIEGTQGFGLSLHHSDHFPFVTSRDTTAAAFISDAGLSPLQVDDIILVLRTYPIRVAGNSGPLKHEVTWETVQERSRSVVPLAEYTTVTGELRRIAEFDWELARQAIRVNRPTALALHGADYLNCDDYGKTHFEDLSDETVNFVYKLEATFRVPVRYVFTGPAENHIVRSA